MEQPSLEDFITDDPAPPPSAPADSAPADAGSDDAADSSAASAAAASGAEPAETSAAGEADAAPSPTPPTQPETPARNADGTFKKGAKKNPQARIDAITYEREEARRELQRERDERTRLEQRLAALEARSQPQPARETRPVAPHPVIDPSDPEPQEADYDDYGKFVKAQARWEARQEFRTQQRAYAEQAQHQHRVQLVTERVNAYAKRMSEAADANPTFLASLSPDVLNLKPLHQLAPGEPVGPLNALAEELIDSPYAPQLAQHFSEHPDDLRRFSALHPRVFLREFAKLEARFETAPPGSVPKPPAISQAKPPIQPVGSAPPASGGPPGEDASFDDHMRDYSRRTKMPMPTRRV